MEASAGGGQVQKGGVAPYMDGWLAGWMDGWMDGWKDFDAM